MATKTDEIVLPEGVPGWEWILGRPVQKVVSKRRHSVVQANLVPALKQWARGKGTVATEWVFRPAPWGEPRRPLAPDISYISFERLLPLDAVDRESPPLGPDIVIEVRSTSSNRCHLEHKRDVFFATGTQLFVIVDPEALTVDAWTEAGTVHQRFTADETFVTASFPDLAIPLATIFEGVDLPENGGTERSAV